MRTLVLEFGDGEERCKINFDLYGLMLYYSKKLNEEKAGILFKCMRTEYFYKVNREFHVGNLTVEDEGVAASLQEMSETINFINIEVIPALSLENQGIMKKYGGTKNFHLLFHNETGFTEDIILDDDYQEDDSGAYSKANIIHCFKYLRNFIQYALSNSSLYTVSVDF